MSILVSKNREILIEDTDYNCVNCGCSALAHDGWKGWCIFQPGGTYACLYMSWLEVVEYAQIREYTAWEDQ